ncbi:MAG: class A beta-lactamase-related serine hydrolase [Actinomycetota bacterium]|nr:class A beta-lactamase-related serine hydrolase [Actinomycetota bacterium]
MKTPLSRKRRVIFDARAKRRRYWRRRVGLVVLALLLGAGVMYAAAYGQDLVPTGDRASTPDGQVQRVAQLNEPAVQEKILDPPDALKLKETPASSAYLAVAGELPGVSRESLEAVYKSGLDPNWAAVRFDLEGEEGDYVLFLEKVGRAWEVRRSVLTDEPDYEDNEQAVLGGVPKDLAGSLYTVEAAENGTYMTSDLVSEPFDRDGLPKIGDPQYAPPDPVLEDVPAEERGRVEADLEKLKEEIEGYQGVAGVYVRDIESGWGYGIRPDEEFFSASVIKVPIMVAVYRKVDSGELSFTDSFPTEPGDWAAGAGWMQWEDAGRSYTVGDYLWMMMTQSDNVATNALVRVVGGPDHVNEVARSLGAENTTLYQKVTSERGVVPEYDNRTTTRDMSIMLDKIARGEAASLESCRYMVELMQANVLDSWLEDPLPEDVMVANKGGWLYGVYDEVAIISHPDHPYAVSILTKYGPDPETAKPMLRDISQRVWEIQDAR